MVNNMIGPGFVALPTLFQTAGWLTPTIGLVVLAALGALAAGFLVEVMAMIPGNGNLSRPVEFGDVASAFLRGPWLLSTHILLSLSLMTLCVGSCIEAAQNMDWFFVAILGETCGLELIPSPGITCTAGVAGAVSPFSFSLTFSLGLGVVAAICVPLGFVDLEDNIYFQYFCFLAMFVLTGMWMYYFQQAGFEFDNPKRLPVVGPNQSAVLGELFFNFAFVITVPTWVNSKAPSVNVNRVVWSSVFICAFLFWLNGLFGAAAFDLDVDGSQTIFTDKLIEKFGLLSVAGITTYVFSCSQLISGIPIFCIIIRENLIAAKLMGPSLANVFAIGVPWALTIAFYTGDALESFINWLSLFVNGFVNYFIPYCIFCVAVYGGLVRDPTEEDEVPQDMLEVLYQVPTTREELYQLNPPTVRHEQEGDVVLPWYKQGFTMLLDAITSPRSSPSPSHFPEEGSFARPKYGAMGESLPLAEHLGGNEGAGRVKQVGAQQLWGLAAGRPTGALAAGLPATPQPDRDLDDLISYFKQPTKEECIDLENLEREAHNLTTMHANKTQQDCFRFASRGDARDALDGIDLDNLEGEAASLLADIPENHLYTTITTPKGTFSRQVRVGALTYQERFQHPNPGFDESSGTPSEHVNVHSALPWLPPTEPSSGYSRLVLFCAVCAVVVGFLNVLTIVIKVVNAL